MKIFRFIKKVNEYEYIPVEVDEVLPEAVQNSANQELYDIEQKEEELGISFILLVNILTDGIYEEYEQDQFRHIPGEDLIVDIRNKCLLYYNLTENDRRVFYFERYRDNWALTKEDLILPF